MQKAAKQAAALEKLRSVGKMVSNALHSQKTYRCK